MLVLSRKTDEQIVIIDPVTDQVLATVMVVEIRGREVKLGFDADPAIPIHRQEVWDAIQEKVLAASATHPT